MNTKVISGKYKGKTILIPKISTTRATKQIVRESVINSLRDDLPFVNFVEVFAGSGSMGIEAISNGVRFGYFIEQNKQAYETLQKNFKNLHITNATALFGDSFIKIKDIEQKLLQKKEKAIFYIDPPFNIRVNQSDIYQKTINLIKNLHKESVFLIVIEHLSSFSFDETVGNFKKIKFKKFGKSALSYLE